MRKIILFLTSCVFLTSVFADHGVYTYAKHGNIFFYSNNQHKVLQLTHDGIDKDPVLSPNREWLVFIRKTNHVMSDNCAAFAETGSKYSDEIWVYDFKKMQLHRLVKNNFLCNHPTKMIVDPQDLLFSPDSKTVYFETSAWATSDAIHAINPNGKKLRLVTDANEYHVIQHGIYKGDLVVNQHRYHSKGGSYDWDWLFSPGGKQIKLYRREE